MFAYCNNNPISFIDENGKWPTWEEIKDFFEKDPEDFVENIFDAAISSIEARVGVGPGIGVSLFNVIRLDFSRDSYIGFDDGVTIAGNYLVLKGSIFEFIKLGDTYDQVTEKDGQRVSSGSAYDSPFDMMHYPETVRGNKFSAGAFTINNDGEFVISSSAGLHFILGGHYSIGFNVSEFFERLFD